VRKDRDDKLIVPFRNFAKAPKNSLQLFKLPQLSHSGLLQFRIHCEIVSYLGILYFSKWNKNSLLDHNENVVVVVVVDDDDDDDTINAKISTFLQNALAAQTYLDEGLNFMRE